MKIDNLILCVILLVVIMISCTNKHSHSNMKECLPGSVCILPFGDGNKPPRPLFITTEGNDTTYYKYDIEDNLENMENVGYIIAKDYFMVHKVDSNLFLRLKQFIIEHKTNNNYTMLNGKDNTIKIVLMDCCDSLSYTIDNENKNYFQNIINCTDTKDVPLNEYFNYYERIINSE